MKAIAALLFMVTGALLLVGSLTLANLWDDYQDSPDSMYIETAAIVLGLALLAAVGGLFALRRK